MKSNNQLIKTTSKCMQLTSVVATTLLLVLTNSSTIFVSGQNNRPNITVPVSAPTVNTNIVRQSIGPSYSEQCLICNTTDMIFANGSQIVTIAGTNGSETNCSDLYYGGFLALIPLQGCPLAKAAGCNCIKMTSATNSNSTSDQPSISMSPSISMLPTSMSSTVPSLVPSPGDLTPPPVNAAPMTPVAVPVSVPVPGPTSVPIAATSSSSSVSSNGSKYTIVLLLLGFVLTIISI